MSRHRSRHRRRNWVWDSFFYFHGQQGFLDLGLRTQGWGVGEEEEKWNVEHKCGDFCYPHMLPSSRISKVFSNNPWASSSLFRITVGNSRLIHRDDSPWPLGPRRCFLLHELWSLLLLWEYPHGNLSSLYLCPCFSLIHVKSSIHSSDVTSHPLSPCKQNTIIKVLGHIKQL